MVKKIFNTFDSTYFWLSSKFKDDHNLLGSRQLILLSGSETLYLIEPILLFMYYFLPDETREIIKPYGKGLTLVLYFALIYINRKRYLTKLEKEEEVKNFYSDIVYWLILFLPLIVLLALFYRPWLPPPV